jgi:hypothetical protein
MLHVVLEQIRRARQMLAEDLRMGAIWCATAFICARVAARPWRAFALAVDKDHSPRWNPASIEEVSDAEWQAFFDGPWPAFTRWRRCKADWVIKTKPADRTCWALFLIAQRFTGKRLMAFSV